MRSRHTWAVLGTGAVLFFLGLGNHDLWNPNEPVFAEGAREMLLRGEWLVPYVNGQLYVDKPILYFWAILLASLPGGEVTAFSARLPSAVAALLTLWAVLRFGRRAFGDRAALLAGLVLATMPIFTWEARFAQMDPMLVLFTFLCLASFHRARIGNTAVWLASSGAWAGLALLTKGPVGLVLPGAAALVALAWDREWRFLLRVEWIAGAAAFLAVGAPWYLAVAATEHASWLSEFFLRQNVTRFIDPFDHARPFYYYAIRFLSDLFPWSLLVPLVVLDRPDPGAASREEIGAWRVCMAYVAVVLVFFSISGAKRGVYILPLYPAYALLVGRLWDRALSERLAGRRRRLLAGLMAAAGAALALIGAYAAVAAGGRFPEFRSVAAVLGSVSMAAGIGLLVTAGKRDLRRAFGATVGGLAAVYLVAVLWVVPKIDPYKSARAFSERVRFHAGAEAPLRSYRFWKWRSEYIFYSGRLMPILRRSDETARFLSRPERVFLLVKEDDRDRLEREVQAPLYRLETDTVGDTTIHLFSNRRSHGEASGGGAGGL